MPLTRTEQQLVLHEGLRTKPYQDTEGFWTIGVGYNVDGRGWKFLEQTIGRKVGHLFDPNNPTDLITRDEAILVLRADIARIEKSIRTYLPEYDSLNDVRKRVVIDMAFNMQFKALGFKKAIDALRRKDWSRVARELYNSKWARQVGDGEGGRFDRADRLARMMLTGLDYVS